MTASNIVGVDPHRLTFTATVLDSRGGELGHAHFPNTRQGHDAGLAWAAGLGPADRWGVEGASGLGRHLAEFLVAAGCDVRDVPPHKTTARQRGRHEGKTDRLDSHRVAAETQTNPRLARAFKHAVSAAPDSVREPRSSAQVHKWRMDGAAPPDWRAGFSWPPRVCDGSSVGR
jgi:transposase